MRYAWPDGAAVRVRMGLHTGEPLVAEDHYVGVDVHRGARIAAAAHGGQALVSERTRELVAGNGWPGTFHDIGAHRLKDLPEPERLYQLVLDGLPRSFPPPRVHEDALESAGLPDYSLPPAAARSGHSPSRRTGACSIAPATTVARSSGTSRATGGSCGPSRSGQSSRRYKRAGDRIEPGR